MTPRITAKEAAELTGYSVSWLKRYTCGWCAQTALSMARGYCGTIFGPKCDTISRCKDLRENRALSEKDKTP